MPQELIFKPPITVEGGNPKMEKGALFVKVGSIANGLSYGHVSTTINLQVLEDRLEEFRNLTKAILEFADFHIINKNFSHIYAQASSLADWIELEVSDTQAKLESVLTAFDPTRVDKPNTVRPKRQIITGITTALFGGLIGSLFTGFGLNTLTSVVDGKEDVLASEIEEQELILNQNRRDIELLNGTVNGIYDGLQKLIEWNRDINAQQMALYVSWAVTENLRAIRQTIDAIVSAHQGHFTNNLVKTGALGEAISSLRQRALRSGRELGINSLADCYGLPTSYLYQPSRHSVSIIIHVPMYRIGRSLTLWRHIRTPILWTEGTNHTSFIEVTSDHEFIGISDDRTTYRTYTSNTLEECLKIGHLRFCSDTGIYKVAARESCLTGLLLNDPKVVRRNCQLNTLTESTRIVRLNATTYAVISPFDDVINIRCRNKDTATQYYKGVTLVHLETGCVANTKEVKIERGQYEPPVEVQGLIINSPLTLESLTPDHTEKEIQDIFNMRKTLGSMASPISIQHLSKFAGFQRQFQALEQQHTQKYGYPLIGIVCVLVLSTLAFCVCGQRNSRCQRVSDLIRYRRPIRRCCHVHQQQDRFGHRVDPDHQACADEPMEVDPPGEAEAMAILRPSYLQSPTTGAIPKRTRFPRHSRSLSGDSPSVLQYYRPPQHDLRDETSRSLDTKDPDERAPSLRRSPARFNLQTYFAAVPTTEG